MTDSTAPAAPEEPTEVGSRVDAGPTHSDSAVWTPAMEEIVSEHMSSELPFLPELYENYENACDSLRKNPEFADYPFLDARALDGLSPMAQQYGLQLLGEGVYMMSEEGGGVFGGTGRDAEYYDHLLETEDLLRMPVTGFAELPYMEGVDTIDPGQLRAAQDARLRILQEYATELARYRTLNHFATSAKYAGQEISVAAQRELPAQEEVLVALRRKCAREMLALLGAQTLPEFE